MPCQEHPSVYTIPGHPCATCKQKLNAELRGVKKQAEEMEERLERAKGDGFLVGDRQRKKPGVKSGRASFEDLNRDQTTDDRRVHSNPT